MQSFGDCRNAVLEPSEAVHSTRKKVGKAEDKVLCFAQKLYQEEKAECDIMNDRIDCKSLVNVKSCASH